MPPSPKSRRASVSAPKGRGAQRAKSGCYTCRIRRKKCDENQDHEHRCTTCVRLKLECLGFGAKRPEWLRDNRNVVALRERIKAFLASQGMIKGHSGSRNAEDEPATLQLHPETESSSGSSPSPGSGSSTTMSSPESRPLSFVEEKTTQAAISASREVPWDGGATGIGGSDPSYELSHGSGPRFYREDPCPPSHSLMATCADPFFISDTLACRSNRYNNNAVHYNHLRKHTEDDPVPITPLTRKEYNKLSCLPSRATVTDFPILSPDCLIFDQADYYEPIPRSAHHVEPDKWIFQYLSQIIGVQYLLVDKDDYGCIVDSITENQCTQDAVRLLSATYTKCSSRRRNRALGSGPGSLDDGEAAEIEKCKRNLQVLENITHATPNDVMSALHLVSSVLFTGGTGDWEKWLGLACKFTRNLTGTSSTLYYSESLEMMLLGMDKRMLFTIKTTLWFDVLASVTTGKEPMLMDLITRLFDPNLARIDDGRGTSSGPAELSMLSVMGCENTVVWAIAETSKLAAWKAEEMKHGQLSVVELVRRGKEIDQYLDDGTTDGYFHSEEYAHTNPYYYQSSGYNVPMGGATSTHAGMRHSGANNPDLEETRRQTARIFRNSARIYLHSIISGGYPSCPEISKSVRATLQCFREVSGRGSSTYFYPRASADSSSRFTTDYGSNEKWRPIVRSVVFSIYICGCLTGPGDETSRQFFRDRLEEQFVEGVGNCKKVKAQMEKVWENSKKAGKNEPVDWRGMLVESGKPLLLV